ncbi:hypothetical protein NC652_011949 [Populus alba x Populus x berolinensis]|nr:hypothetical protein NC652_011949 [Populus alba x Populus x berolinensis]
MVVASRFLLALAYHLKPSLSSWILAVTLSGSLAPLTALSPPPPQESNLNFISKQTSSSKLPGCKNPKCFWIHHTNIRCDQDCSPVRTNTNSCLQQACPPYIIFWRHCTIRNSPPPQSNQTTQLPCRVLRFLFPAASPRDLVVDYHLWQSQLGLHKFSYCLLALSKIR